jgi:hypothetical protein
MVTWGGAVAHQKPDQSKRQPMSKGIADRFRQMADRIEKNDAEPFAGAVLIIPPGDGVVVEMLNLDPSPDAALFWGAIRSKADEAVADLQAQARQQQSFRR